MINIKDFLVKFNKLYPAHKYGRHALSVEDDLLMFYVFTPFDRWYSFGITNEDLEKSVDDLAMEIIDLIPKHKPISDSAEDVS